MPKKQFEKIRQLGIEKEVLTPQTPYKIEQQLRNKGIRITDDTIRKYRETVIQSGIIDIDEERKNKINRLIANSIESFEKIQLLFQKNIDTLYNYPDLIEEIKSNPMIIKLLNTIFNQNDKLIRLIQLLNPSKAIDLELIKKQKKRVVTFDNLD